LNARTVLVSVLLAGCGGGTPSGASGTAGTSGAAGTTGTAGTTGGGGAGGTSAPSCRTYATAYTYVSSQGTTASYACSHSETSGFDRTCTTSGFSSVEHWPSRGDFVDEAAAVGIMRVASITTSAAATYEYDGQKRLQRILNAGVLYATCDDWDDLGRCKHEVMAGSCAGSQSAISYGAHTVTYDTTGGSCTAHTTTTFDSDGIMVSVDYGQGTTANYNTTSRATVCR